MFQGDISLSQTSFHWNIWQSVQLAHPEESIFLKEYMTYREAFLGLHHYFPSDCLLIFAQIIPLKTYGEIHIHLVCAWKAPCYPDICSRNHHPLLRARRC